MRFKPNKGIAIWGQKTLYGEETSAFSRANCRWALIVIENSIEALLEDFEFEQNDDITRSIAGTSINNYLASVKSRRGLYDFDVVIPAVEDDGEAIDNYEMNVDYYLQLVKGTEYINARAIITPTGVTYELLP